MNGASQAETAEGTEDSSGVGSFRIVGRDGVARSGEWRLVHGRVPTPCFMPVGTQATVKALTPEELCELGAPIILANAYHLYLRPGHELIRERGGLHAFMGWQRPILTDSGGYQVFSLASINKVTDEGVWFQSHIDGSRHFVTPELVIDVQRALGADAIMAFDECPPGRADRATAARAVARTQAWLERCAGRFRESEAEASAAKSGQALLPVLQGGTYLDLRRRSLHGALALGEWPGFGIGGLSVGEPKDEMYEVLESLQADLPEDGIRYLMGVGYPGDLIEAIRLGYDLFDCVAPTRNGRNGTAFTSAGTVNVKIAAWKDDDAPIEPDCECYACRSFSRSYIRHLFVTGELLGLRLVSIHNLHFLTDLTIQAREAIEACRFDAWATDWLTRYRS